MTELEECRAALIQAQEDVKGADAEIEHLNRKITRQRVELARYEEFYQSLRPGKSIKDEPTLVHRNATIEQLVDCLRLTRADLLWKRDRAKSVENKKKWGQIAVGVSMTYSILQAIERGDDPFTSERWERIRRAQARRERARPEPLGVPE